MRCRVCTTHSPAKRTSHWWQQCWSIKDSTFYPENSANSGGQLTPRQPGSGASWRFSPPWSLWSAAEPHCSLLMRCCACCECGKKEFLRAAAPVVVYASVCSVDRQQGACRWAAPQGNYAQPLESLHRGIVGIFVCFSCFLSLSLLNFFFPPPKSHKWNIKRTSVACVRLKGAFICILGQVLVGNVITSVNSRHTFQILTCARWAQRGDMMNIHQA